MRPDQRGFSLLEILVAFSILALSLGVLMQIFSGSLRNADITRDQAQAVLLAQTLLAGAGVESRLAAGERSGIAADKFRWSLRVAPYAQDPGAGESRAAATPLSLDLWAVTARVAWGGDMRQQERAISLETLRVQAPATP